MVAARHQIADDWPATPAWVQRTLDNVISGRARVAPRLPPKGRLLREGFTFVRPLFECFHASRLLQREDFLALFLACDTLCEHGCVRPTLGTPRACFSGHRPAQRLIPSPFSQQRSRPAEPRPRPPAAAHQRLGTRQVRQRAGDLRLSRDI